MKSIILLTSSFLSFSPFFFSIYFILVFCGAFSNSNFLFGLFIKIGTISDSFTTYLFLSLGIPYHIKKCLISSISSNVSKSFISLYLSSFFVKDIFCKP